MGARELDELRALESAAAAEPVPEPSPFLFTRALARVEEYERHRARRHWWQLSPALAATVIAAQFVLILFAAALLVNRQRQFESLVRTRRRNRRGVHASSSDSRTAYPSKPCVRSSAA